MTDGNPGFIGGEGDVIGGVGEAIEGNKGIGDGGSAGIEGWGGVT